jgi:phosphopantothenate---cysteine ligase (CTP)
MNVVVTGGGTIAPIDDVRHIANASTGRFSAMISEACLRRGATVWHVHAPNALLPLAREARFDLSTHETSAEHQRLDRLRQQWLTARDRLHLVGLEEGTVHEYSAKLESVFRNHRIDVAFLAMAVSDFEPVQSFSGKLETPHGALSILCKPTHKVIGEVRDWAPHVYLVGFKLLSRVGEARLIAAAEEACVTNRADLTVANDLVTLRAGCHTIHLVRPGKPAETYREPEAVAERLVERTFLWAQR